MAFTFGEQAICSSPREVMEMPVRQRDLLLKKIKEAYDKQREDMEKSNKGKGRSGGGKTRTVASY